MFFAVFLCLQFGYVMFWQKEIDKNAAHKLLVKFTSALPCL